MDNIERKTYLKKSINNVSFINDEFQAREPTSLNIFIKDVKQNENYQKFISSNIYIVGSVASGKNELIERLERYFSFNTIDPGKLFRICAYAIIVDSEENSIKPNIELLSSGNIEEKNRVTESINNKKELIKNILKKSSYKMIDGKSTFFYDNKPFINELESRNVNLLVSSIAPSPIIRSEIWRFINNYFETKSNIVITGRILEEVDCSKFKTIFLYVDEDEAARRLLKRSYHYKNKDTAIKDIRKRNGDDNINDVYLVGKDMLNSIHINTTNISSDQVFIESVNSILKICSS